MLFRSGAQRGEVQPGGVQPRGVQPGGAQPGGALGAVGAVLPYLTVIMAAVLPLAAGIYLLTSSAWTLAERSVLARRIGPAGRPQPGGAGPVLA